MRIRRSLSLAVLLLAFAALLPAAPAGAAPFTFVVNVTSDDTDFDICSQPPAGDCSLREALLHSESHPGLDRIHFGLGAGVPTINIVSALPEINHRVIINGNTGGATRIELTGPAGPDSLVGLSLVAGSDGSVIRRLIINEFSRGVSFDDTNDNVLSGSWLGLDETGLASGGGAVVGVDISESANNVIGGLTAGTRNVITANDIAGISIFSNTDLGGNEIVGNYIGPNAAGTAGPGIFGHGINVLGSDDNHIHQNVLGTIGSGGIEIRLDATGNVVAGNRIGIDVNGDSIQILGPGIRIIDTATGNTVSQNFIENVTQGIGLGVDGVTPNDNADADTGPNGLQNFPVLTRADAIDEPPFTRVNGRMRSAPNRTYVIELFTNSFCDPTGHGDGEAPLDLFQAVTDAVGRLTFSEEAPLVPVGTIITATATDSVTGSTSEFSACAAVI